MKTKKMNMGGRTGDMMYSRGYGVGKRGKRMPTELMTAPGMKKGGGVSKRTKHIMNEKDEIRRVDKEIRKNEGYATGGMLARTGGSSAPMKAKGKKMMGGGKVKAYKKGGSVGSASKRADGIAQRGHTRGRIV